jgi:hypothetical protein
MSPVNSAFSDRTGILLAGFYDNFPCSNLLERFGIVSKLRQTVPSHAPERFPSTTALSSGVRTLVLGLVPVRGTNQTTAESWSKAQEGRINVEFSRRSACALPVCGPSGESAHIGAQRLRKPS